MTETTLLSFPASPSTADASLDDPHPDKMKPKSRSVVRCLFGRPDPVETNAWLRNRLNELQQEQNQRWNFDFVNYCPLGSGGRFDYVPVPESTVPSFYRTKTIAKRRRRPSTAEENEAPLIAPDCLASASSSSSAASLLSATESLSGGALELGAGRFSCITTPAGVKRQDKITAHLQVRKRRMQQRLPKVGENDKGPRSSSSTSSSASSSCHSVVSNVGHKRARVEESASSSLQ